MPAVLPMLDAVPSSQDSGPGEMTTPRGKLPLAAVDVQARVAGLLAGVSLRQEFVNEFDEPLEAMYVFPLPSRAAVHSFHLEVAGRVVEGVLQEKGAARRTYQRAMQAGHRAALAEEERPGVFTMRVGNLPPGERAVVRLEMSGPLPVHDGEATFRFPLVIAPRYGGSDYPHPAVKNPGAPATVALSLDRKSIR
ncbi:MAG: hypothetical protein K2W96_14630, partial [Gemmataceae bacterium]|nr:hypothetical protein [Gemmataceae bacterium]